MLWPKISVWYAKELALLSYWDLSVLFVMEPVSQINSQSHILILISVNVFFLIENNALYVAKDVIMTLQINQKFYLVLNRNFIPLVEVHSFYHDHLNQIYSKNIILIPCTLTALSEWLQVLMQFLSKFYILMA